MKKIYPFIALLTYTIVFVLLLDSNRANALDTKPRGPHHQLMEQLTEEQQKEIRDRVNELWESGATQEEIHTEVTDMLNEYGIDVPEDFKGFDGERGPRHGRGFLRFTEQLSEEQKESIQDKIKALRDEGATRDEIHVEVAKMLKNYGVEIPEDFKGFHGKRGHRSGRGLMHLPDELTDEQREAIREKRKSMHEQGASREEIHIEIGNMLKTYGIEPSDDLWKHREIMENLNPEQRKMIRVKIREMRKDGVPPEEIREEINKMLEKFGINESNEQIDQQDKTSGKKVSIRNYPNPFNPQTNIEYNLTSSAQVSITIFDIQGKQIKMLFDDYRQAGTYHIKWSGLNESGIQVPSGVYFIRISAGDETLNHRIVMMK